MTENQEEQETTAVESHALQVLEALTSTIRQLHLQCSEK